MEKRCCDILRELREEKDKTQQQIAELLGTTQQVYSNYENGRDLPIRHLKKLCEFYGVSADYILNVNGEYYKQ